MGKSEIQSMPIHRSDNLICVPDSGKELSRQFATELYITADRVEKEKQETNEKIFEIAADMAETNKQTVEVPAGMEVLSNQVAGHMNKRNVCMLKENGTVLKPLVKKECGEREIHFYKSLENTEDQPLIELREFVPKFHGVKKVPINGKEYDCLVLEDLTKNYKEPCIMDIKIGRRTWDPQASYDKIVSEEKKYHESKRDLGFCIPGFQVYKIYNNQLVKYGKDFGRSLNRERTEDAMKTFLNADGSGFCRRLIVQFLAALWRIQHWARNQRRLRLYASSILLVYDARRLREHVKHIKIKSPLKLTRVGSLYRPLSLAVLNNDCCEKIQTGFSGQFTKEGPILRSPTSPMKLLSLDVPNNVINNKNMWQKSIRTLKRTHSFQNNYDKDVQNKKQTYAYLLDDLCGEPKSEMWAAAKMIDFAHVYPAENCDIDTNYLEGIESLVRLFEEYLVESE